MQVRFHIQVGEGKGHVGPDLGGVKLVTESLQVNAQDLQK